MEPVVANFNDIDIKIINKHYENFPVASFFLPKNIREHVQNVYAFARAADDIADEGELTRKQRSQQLQKFYANLDLIAHNQLTNNQLFEQLKTTIHNCNIPIGLFYKLLDAFSSDLNYHEYKNFNELEFYCQRSANPIGRILLYIHNQYSDQKAILSDKICTALQLINILQDFNHDLLERDRCYIPLGDIQRYNLSIIELKNNQQTPNKAALFSFQLLRARNILNEGQKLLNLIQGRLRFEVKLIIKSAYTMLEKLDNRQDIHYRPHLTKLDFMIIFFKALIHANRNQR